MKYKIARKFLSIPAILVCNLAVAQPPTSDGRQEKILKETEEPHHKVVLENKYIRLIEGKVPVKDTTLMHIHEANSVVVFLSKTSFGIQSLGGKPVITDVTPGYMFYRAYGDKPVTHIVWDQGVEAFHFYVAEIVRRQPNKDSCSILSQPGLQFQWQEKSVRAYYVDIAKGAQFELPASSCAYILIDISGEISALSPGDISGSGDISTSPAGGPSASSSGDTRPLAPDGYAFFPPQKNIRINGGKENSRCILLELL